MRDVESFDERHPQILSKAIARGETNGMLLIQFARWLSKKETAQFADVREALVNDKHNISVVRAHRDRVRLPCTCT